MPDLGRKPYDTSKNPLGEFAGAGDFDNLNVKGGSFDGLPEGDAEADKALSEWGRLKAGGSSSIKAHGRAKIPGDSGAKSTDE